MGFDVYERTCYYGPHGQPLPPYSRCAEAGSAQSPVPIPFKGGHFASFQLNGVPDYSPSVRGPDSKWNKWSRMAHFFGLASSLRPANHPKSLASLVSRDPGFPPR